MDSVYHLWLNGEAKGPFTINQLRSMWAIGNLTGETPFSTDKGANWQYLSHLSELLDSSPEPIHEKKSGGCLIAILIFAIAISGIIGFLNVSPGDLEISQQNKVAFEDKTISTEEQLGGMESQVEQWKETRTQDTEAFNQTKTARETCEAISFGIAAFCFLCILIVRGRSK